MRPVNPENGIIMLKMPVELKRKIYEEAERKGISLTPFVLQILWDWVEREES